MSSLSEASREELIDLAVRHARELGELRQQQAATAEVLRAINRQDVDLAGVLSMLTKSAADLCEAGSSALFLRVGDTLVARGTANLDAEQETFVRKAAAPVDASSYIGRAVLFGATSNVADFLAEAGSSLTHFQKILGFRAMLVVPLMREGHGLGVFTLARPTIGAFTDRQVDLVRTFADQAAIAVRNAGLIDELHMRTDELALSLAQLGDAQDRLVRSAKLAALGRLVAGVAHEMNTPVGNALTVATTIEHDVRLFADALENGRLLRSDLARGVARLGEGSALIRTNLTRAIDLIQRFRQVASDKPAEAHRPIDVRLWADTLFRGHLGLAQSGHEIGIDCPDGFATAGHPDLWAQIVTCLIDNSLQHAFREGTRGRIGLVIREAGSRDLVLLYSDDGIGIAPDAIGQIFEPFYTTARSAGAAGLGLHIAHNLAASCGGHISVASELGEGARFTIRLPRL